MDPHSWSRLRRASTLVVALLATCIVLLAISLAADLPVLREVASVVGGLGGACVGFVILFAWEDRKGATRHPRPRE
jgi:hypothetical protein